MKVRFLLRLHFEITFFSLYIQLSEFKMPETNQFIIHQITDVNSADFHYCLSIYREAFPPNEKQPEQIICERVEKKKSVLYCLKYNSKIVGITLLWDFKNSKFQLLDYFAIIEEQRKIGMGSFFFKEISNLVNQTGKRLIMEVEHPAYGNNKSERKRRIDFYIKNGSFILNHVPYILPPLDGTIPTEMFLLIAPGSEGEVFNRTQIIDLINRIYLELYERDKNDFLLNKFIDKLSEEIILTTNYE